MGVVELQLRCSKNLNGVAVDPEPNWNFDVLVSEINALELELHGSLTGHGRLPKKKEFSNGKHIGRNDEAFVMRVADDEMVDAESDEEEIGRNSLMTGRRFSCVGFDLSDTEESEDDIDLEMDHTFLLDKKGREEGVLFESELENQLRIKEEIRNKISGLEADLSNESEKSSLALIRVEKFTEAREMDRRLDTQYQRKIAEALDSHLSAVQRVHEQRSQIEERKIRSDAAFEEAKRKEKALHEEKLRQEKAKAEAEVRLKAATKAALDAERRAAKEAAEREAAENAIRVAEEEAQKKVSENKRDASAGDVQSKELGSDILNKVQSAGIKVKAAETAIKVEAERLGKYKELAEKNHMLKQGSSKVLNSYERQIARQIRQIGGTQENARAKVSELLKMFNDPLCPQSISIEIFAKKVVTLCENPTVSFNSTSFACGHVIVLVTSQVPAAMDIVLAEFHKACIYTVPKHIHYSESAFKSKEAYYKMIGYREEDGKIESTAQFLEGVESYMTLYAALVQTEVHGVRNLHGLNEGWAWLARFLNMLPANIFTAVALAAFLKMAGFALFRKYRSQFKKILNVISHQYLVALKAQGDSQLNRLITEIEWYIDTNQFLVEPQGRRLQTSLLSDSAELDSGYHQEQYHSYRNFYP